MVRRNGAEIRKQRIHEITRLVLKLLHQGKGEISLSKALARLKYETGLTHEKLMEYLTVAAGAGFFKIDEESDRIRLANRS